jgi:hypothetical protein
VCGCSNGQRSITCSKQDGRFVGEAIGGRELRRLVLVAAGAWTPAAQLADVVWTTGQPVVRRVENPPHERRAFRLGRRHLAALVRFRH